MVDILCELLRLQGDGQPMTIVQLAGFPAEVFDAIVSVLFRLAFEFGLWSDGALPLLIVCEEAHNYANADRSRRLPAGARGGVAHRQGGPQIRRLPRPGDAAPGAARSDPDLAMLDRVRHAHGERGRPAHRARRGVRSRPTGCSASLPSLGTREALAFGAGVPVATRLRFKELPDGFIPTLAKRSGAAASTPARRSTATWSPRWWRAGAASP